ncbi:hypothetical protein [Paraburkholderia tropica]|uniref:hypothetical protein n=1 Tax=Paraburkholderia tropica TaxID=92647 RepID=UPI002AB27D3E|nr:hypothetical protein [Paraburkholderia tropica]
MLRWILTWAARHAPTPQKLAERSLSELRMSLFQAEQRVLDAQFQANYYRTRIAFYEDVLNRGIEQVSAERKEQSLPSGRPSAPELKVARSPN